MAPSVAIEFPSRLEWFDSVDSTNDVVAGWLRDGVPEVCVAAADEQNAGRGRSGRSWTAPSGAALLCSVGFRPTWLDPERAWRLAAIVSLAMADTAESEAGLPPGTIRLKWPNDLVIETDAVRKLAGVLGETDGLGTADARAIIGIGVNAAWPRATFPPDIAESMTSLAEAAQGIQIDRYALLNGFIDRLATRVEALREGHFDADGWSARQLTNGRPVRLEQPDGRAETVQALGVDPGSGALVVAGETPEAGPRSVLVGEIRHLRIGGLV
ncbi:MAG TPA: biotin--[acetyl-CoA-carboxylase] ligase [Candidatus Limnocylindrales bacterium]|nr:biotin--[acetyl-CoA-carboxylase] ligase [Candidatus Limnocylindrales bacterium]